MSSLNICEALSRVAESIALLVVELVVEVPKVAVPEVEMPEVELVAELPRSPERATRLRRASSGQRCSSWSTLANAPQCW
jgi:hypothetical protein